MNRDCYSFQWKALGGTCDLLFFARNKDHARLVLRESQREVSRIENKFSRYLPESVIGRINREAFDSGVDVDEETASLLRFAEACYQISRGRFDITSGAYRKVWNFATKKCPTEEQLELIRPLVGWNQVNFDGQRFQFLKPGMEIDFGGFGKELAVDNVSKVMATLGISSGLINFGGDILALGPKPNGEEWKVGIQHPRRRDSILAYVKVRKGALASSGDYERYFEHGGVRYCHVLDATTGWPCYGVQQVSVEAESCLLAGSFSTLGMLFGEEEGRSFLSEQKLRHLLVNAKGEVRTYPDNLLRVN